MSMESLPTDINDKFVKLAGDASSRVYYRFNNQYIFCDYGSVNPLVLERYVYWTNKFLEHRINVPKVVKKLESSLYIEDLGDEVLYELINQKLFKLDEYIALSSSIIKQIQTIDENPYGLIFDDEKLDFEFNLTKEHYFDGKKNLEGLKNWLHEEFKKVPYVNCHRDFHSKNLILHNKEIYCIDFQDTMKGPYLYDLVSLVDDCYLDLDDDLVEALKEKVYLDYNQSREQFNYDYAIVCMQRLFKVLGSFAYITKNKNNDWYAKHIPIAKKKLSKYFNVVGKEEFIDELNLLQVP